MTVRDMFPYAVVGSLNKGGFISHLQKKKKSGFVGLVRNNWILSNSTRTQTPFNKQGTNLWIPLLVGETHRLDRNRFYQIYALLWSSTLAVYLSLDLCPLFTGSWSDGWVFTSFFGIQCIMLENNWVPSKFDIIQLPPSYTFHSFFVLLQQWTPWTSAASHHGKCNYLELFFE